MRGSPTFRRARALFRSDPVAEAAASASRPNTIFGRRDVAITPWASICCVSVAIVASTLLRDPAGQRDLLILALAGGGALLTAFLARMQYWRLGLLLRNSVGIYLVGCAAMFGALLFFAVRGEGLVAPYFLAAVPTAGYVGLVIPDPWRRASLGVMVVATLGLQAVHASPAGQVVLVTALVVAGWSIGVLGSSAHAQAAQTAEALSRYDHLVGTLSRRGFLEQLRWHLAQPAGAGPLAVLMIDLDDFKRVNDAGGHAAGDAVLAWVGRALPAAVPRDAEIGRLGGDEFAVLLPASTSAQATATAHAVRDRLSERIGASIGVATCAVRPAGVEEMLRAVDGALYASKRMPDVSVCTVAVHPGPVDEQEAGGPPPPPPPLSSAGLRHAQLVPAMPSSGVVFGWMMARGLLILAACGVVVMAETVLSGMHSVYAEIVRYGGAAWLLNFFVLIWASRGRGELAGRRFSAVVHYGGFALGAGVAVAMLAGGGLTSPVAAALYLWVFFVAAILPQRQAQGGAAAMAGWWLVVAVFGPAEALWVAPFQLTVLAASFALGSLGHRAFSDLTSRSLELAHTDAVTGAQNRLGFDQAIEATLATARETDTSFALLALDLDDFKAVNDAEGHAAGDALLARVAAGIAEALPPDATVCRTGGDEFVVIVPGWTTASAEPLAVHVGYLLEPVARASVGHAVCPYDGGTADRLMQAADARSYAQKRHRADARLQAATAPARLDAA